MGTPVTPVVLPVPIITAVENAIVERLTRGLGRMVTKVSTYGGEFDDEGLADVVRIFPAAWVTFGGIGKTVPVSTARDRWKAAATFVVMVGTRSVRSESASRQGGPLAAEIGTNTLIWGVRRLLTQQDLGLPIREFEPGAVKTLFNTRLQREAFSVFALEFHTDWIEYALPPGIFPQPAGGSSQSSGSSSQPADSIALDSLFASYAGQIDPATPDLETVQMNIHLDPTKTAGIPDDVAVATLNQATQES